MLSFQVIEHIIDDSLFLAEAARVLRPDGRLLLVTPDRQYRLLPGQRPWNRWHVREYAMDDLLRQVSRHFRVIDHLYMNLRADVMHLEFRRYRLLKWITLPFTFPGAPEKWRQFGLGLLHCLGKRHSPAGGPYVPEFGLDVIELARSPANSVNLVVIAAADGKA